MIVSQDVPDFHSIKVPGVLRTCVICEEIEHYFVVKGIIHPPDYQSIIRHELLV